MGRKAFAYENIKAWRQENPDKSKKDCRRDLNLSFPTVQKYWEQCGLEKSMSPKEKVESWCKENPEGIIAWCIEDTHLSWMTVKKYWTNGSKKKAAEEKAAKAPKIIKNKAKAITEEEKTMFSFSESDNAVSPTENDSSEQLSLFDMLDNLK